MYEITVTNTNKINFDISANINSNSGECKITQQFVVSVEVFPNPTNGQFNLLYEPTKFNKYIYVEVYNASGVLVRRQRIENVTVGKHIYDFYLPVSSGIYFIRVADDKGKQRNTLISLTN